MNLENTNLSDDGLKSFYLESLVVDFTNSTMVETTRCEIENDCQFFLRAVVQLESKFFSPTGKECIPDRCVCIKLESEPGQFIHSQFVISFFGGQECKYWYCPMEIRITNYASSWLLCYNLACTTSAGKTCYFATFESARSALPTEKWVLKRQHVVASMCGQKTDLDHSSNEDQKKQ